jgi:hypothetical protein
MARARTSAAAVSAPIPSAASACLKSNLCTTDFPTTCARNSGKLPSPLWPPRGARHARGGCGFVGKTNRQFAMGSSTENSGFNPLPTRGSGAPPEVRAVARAARRWRQAPPRSAAIRRNRSATALLRRGGDEPPPPGLAVRAGGLRVVARPVGPLRATRRGLCLKHNPSPDTTKSRLTSLPVDRPEFYLVSSTTIFRDC